MLGQTHGGGGGGGQDRARGNHLTAECDYGGGGGGGGVLSTFSQFNQCGGDQWGVGVLSTFGRFNQCGGGGGCYPLLADSTSWGGGGCVHMFLVILNILTFIRSLGGGGGGGVRACS